MYYIFLLRRVLCVLIPLLVGWLLAQRLQAAIAVLVAAVMAAILSAVGVVLLRGSTVEKVTWRNHMGGWLLPWGYTLGRGQLVGIALVSGTVWTLLAASVIFVATVAPAAVPDVAPVAPPSAISAWWLLPAWIVDGGCVLYLLGIGLKNSLRGTKPGSTLRKLLLALAAMLVGSLVLQLCGHTGLAVLVAGGPPLVLGGTYGLFLLMMLCFGRNVRWN